jgi:hypothetical protein
MKFVRVSMQRAFLPALVLLVVSCSGKDGDYPNGSARGRDWNTSSDLANARRSNQSDMVLQVRLHGLGYDPGPIDGVVGPRTRAALQRYQRDHGLLVSGLPGPATRARLLPASIRLTGGYLPGRSVGRRSGRMSLGPRYPGDIAPFLGHDDGYGLSPLKGTRENFYRILRPEKIRDRQESASKR